MTEECSGEITEETVTVLVADDEPLMCRGLTKLLQSASKEFCLVGCCHDGNQAFQVILNNRIDILITDIRMPILDGLDLARDIRKYKLSTKIIIISGFSQFEYAQQALSYGVVDYLLKPIDNEKLLTGLLQLRNEILAERQINLKDKLARDEFEKNRGLLVENTIFKLAEGIQVPAEQIKSVYNILKNRTRGDEAAVAVFHIKSCSEESAPRPVMEEIITAYNCGCSWIDRWENICILFIHDEYSFIISIFKEISDRLLAVGFKNVKGAISKPFVFSGELFQISQTYFGVCHELKNIASVVLPLIDNSNENNIQITEINRNDDTNCHKTIKKVLNIIENADSLNITVENIARESGLNSNYLSHLFKHETGKSFIEYMTDLRMNKAQELLRTTDLKTYAIARMIGYSDSQYFSQVFKRYIGTSPSQFRKSGPVYSGGVYNSNGSATE